MNDHYRTLISQEFQRCVENTIHRIDSSERTYRPFHSALLSEDVIYWSAFERSFSSSFGQRVIEEIAKIVALSNGATDVRRQKETFIQIDTGTEEAIHNHIQHLRAKEPGYNYDWESSINEISQAPKTNETTTVRVISDVWWKKDGIDNFISLKTVKPNIDQTAVAKEDCLNLTFGCPGCNAYFGLPYNPFGDDRSSYAFNPPMGIFDFHNDSVVLIGRDLWDTIGGEGCYDELISIANEVGIQTKPEIEASRQRRTTN